MTEIHQAAGIRIFVVGHFFKPHKGLPTSQAENLVELLLKSGASVFYASHYSSRLPRLLDTLWRMWKFSKNYDIVQIHSYGGLALILEDFASLWAKFLGKKVVFTLHAGSFPQKIRRFPAWYKRVFARGAALTCPSIYLKQNLAEYLPELQVIPNQIRIKEYPFLNKPKFGPTLLWMRTFEDAYQPEMALEVVVNLKTDYPDIKLYMAGSDRGLLHSVKQKTGASGLENQVFFPGFLTHEDKLRYAELCDIFICTNRIDNAPVSLIEMAALGIPIVSTNAGGIPHLFENGVNALLVDVKDARAMAEAVKDLISDNELAHTLCKNGRLLAEKHDEQHVLNAWIALFRQIKPTGK